MTKKAMILVRRSTAVRPAHDATTLKNNISVWKSALPVLFACAAVAGCGSRPDLSEIDTATYEKSCANEQDFNDNCAGKFVVWDGVIHNDFYFGDDYIRVDVGSRSFDVYGIAVDKADRFNGMRVKFSGYLSQKNMVFDDITDGELVEFLNSPDDVHAEKVASGELPNEEECTSLRNEIHTYGQIEAMCHRITAGSAGESIVASACLSDKVNRLRACGIEIHQSAF